MATNQPGGQNKNNEWFTPDYVMEAARAALGGTIELDPASCELANTIVQANRIFTKDEDGLSLPWEADTAWLNPPYGKIGNISLIRLFTNKLVAEYRAGNIKEAILLSTSDNDASWFKQLWEYPICFSYDNVYFYQPDEQGKIEKNSRHGHWFGTIFVYLGPNERRFHEHFKHIGAVAKLVEW